MSANESSFGEQNPGTHGRHPFSFKEVIARPVAPVFYFHPLCTDGLKEIRYEHRVALMEAQGIVTSPEDSAGPYGLEPWLNLRAIPTHFRPDFEIGDSYSDAVKAVLEVIRNS